MIISTGLAATFVGGIISDVLTKHHIVDEEPLDKLIRITKDYDETEKFDDLADEINNLLYLKTSFDPFVESSEIYTENVEIIDDKTDDNSDTDEQSEEIPITTITSCEVTDPAVIKEIVECIVSEDSEIKKLSENFCELTEEERIVEIDRFITANAPKDQFLKVKKKILSKAIRENAVHPNMKIWQTTIPMDQVNHQS